MTPTREREHEHDDLPILDEIGAGLSAAFAREEQAAEAPRRRRRVRRIALATAALFVIVPGAVATRSIWGPEPASLQPSRPLADSRSVQVAEGRGETLRWRISAYMSPDGICSELSVFSATKFGGRSGGPCVGDLPPGTVLDMRVGGGFGEAIVEGWAAPQVARVEVQPSGRPRRTARIVKVPADRAERAGLPPDLQFYVATFPGELGPGSGLRAVAFDRSGRELGRSEVPSAPSR